MSPVPSLLNKGGVYFVQPFWRCGYYSRVATNRVWRLIAEILYLPRLTGWANVAVQSVSRLRPPLYVLLLQRPAVLCEGLVRLLPHLLELVLLHPLKQLAHIPLARFQLHPLGREGREGTEKWEHHNCMWQNVYPHTCMQTHHIHT